ncbi:MAG TPA: peptidoglycan-binding protein, partial [Crocinitomix sp.]|nr:peptidoglycan-binding protein [Crocinitomix sp.]
WKKPNEFPERYIRVNIASYTLKLWNNHKIISKHRVVVGKYDTQTPEFHAKLRRMVTNPFWHLPYSIASTEFLAHVKKDSNYTNKKGYKIFRNGEEVDPKTVNWNEIKETNFRYRVRQDGGGGNSLGRLKFLFPNSHSVFIHDTPSKRLFMNDVRSYSHGCVRLHQPFELGIKILELDNSNTSPDSLVPIIKRGVQKVIELKQPFEVFIEYYTASADSSGNIIFHPDIYNRDDRFLKNIRKN